MNTDKKQTEQLTQVAVMQSVFKENDLRIGNFIKVISSKKTFDSYITQAKGYDIVRIEEKAFRHWNYEPIPLDEEWLFKFGFRTEEPYCFELDNISINTKRELMWIFTKCKNNVELEIPKYVHELQNLYFALTQRELTVA